MFNFGSLAFLVQGAAQDNSPTAKEDEPEILTGRALTRLTYFIKMEIKFSVNKGNLLRKQVVLV